ncbi:hypothetical protein XI03_07790 [Bradyrhizobium sp. CCBAU 65884]|nr:hypothetical protein [Bradyrhizobium sp. CCBAU 65884]
MADGDASDVVAVGIRPLIRIPVRGAGEHEDLLVLRDGGTGESDVLGRRAEDPIDGWSKRIGFEEQARDPARRPLDVIVQTGSAGADERGMAFNDGFYVGVARYRPYVGFLEVDDAAELSQRRDVRVGIAVTAPSVDAVTDRRARFAVIQSGRSEAA